MTLLKRVGVVVVLMLGAAIVGAQDVDGVVTIGEQYALTLPEMWTAEETEDGLVVLTDADEMVVVTVTDPATLTEDMALQPVEDAEELPALLVQIADEMLALPLEADVVDVLDIEERDGVFATLETDEGARALYLLTMSDDTYGLLDAQIAPEVETLDDTLATLDEIAASFDVAEAAEEPCTVIASGDNITLRTGPGANRASIAFLPAATPFTPIDVTTAEDGSTWFQMNIDEVAPGSAAAELWVAADDVDAAGDCGTVAPPTPTPQPQVEQPADTETDTDTTVDAPEEPATEITVSGNVPNDGFWSLAFAQTTTVTCDGRQPQYLGTSQLIDQTVFSGPLIVVGGGESFIFDGDIYTNNGTSSYILSEGDLVGEDFINVLVTLTVNSSTEMSGGVTFSVVVQGVNCRVSIPMTMTAN